MREHATGPARAEDSPAELHLQRLWFELTRKRAFRTLVLVAADAGIPISPLAHDLARVASLESRGVLLVDADEQDRQPTANAGGYALLSAPPATPQSVLLGQFVPSVRAEQEAMVDGRRKYDRVILAVAAPDIYTASIPLARSADAAVLCVSLGTTRTRAAQRTADLLPADVWLGSLIVASDSVG
jgi:hypothetical protein